MDGVPPLPSGEGLGTSLPQNALLDFFFPGFSVFSTAVHKYLHIDLNLYIPLVMLLGAATFVWRYFSEYFSDLTESYLMSVVDIRVDDEIYNMLMAWVANQKFARSARRFVVNTNLNSRSWWLWRWDDDEDDEEDGGDGDNNNRGGPSRKKKKALAYTPTFGSHWFIYKGRILVFRRIQNNHGSSYLTASEREEISIACFGRNPWILKELLHEARQEYLKRDEAKTLIYRGTTKSGSTEPVWQRCMARTARPLSTVILNEKVKKDLIDDVTDYLNPATRRWYSNRGIPYRRGYLLYGPPGTGKSSLSLALAGFFKMRIYIVSLSSVTANEENLASLFAELPRRCVVLLEDIDTAGLTHTRDDGSQANPNLDDNQDGTNTTSSRNSRGPNNNNNASNNGNNPQTGRLSLSGLLNILDGVASQEGRVLIMTTNHLEKLDKALIRPGRVDMVVKFDRADADMTAAIFRAIYAPLEGDDAPASSSSSPTSLSSNRKLGPKEEEANKREAEAAEVARKKDKEEAFARVDVLARAFAAKIPAHEFSPAEIQGFLLKNKRDPEKAVEGAEQWVADTRKEKKEKELKEAEEKREAEEKAKREREEEEKNKKRKKKKDKKNKKKKDEEEEGSGSEEDDDDDDSKGKKSKKVKKKAKKESKGKSSSSKTSSSKSRKKRKEESESEESSSAESSSSSSSDGESESESERETAAPPGKKRSKTAAPGTETGKPTCDPAPPEVKVEPVLVPAPAAITVDTDKVKEASPEVPKTPQGVDSGYGTP